MNDVHMDIELARESNHQFDRGLLSLGRTAVQPRGVAARVSLRLTKCRRPFRVHEYRQPELRDNRQRLAKIVLADVLKLIDARRAEEALQSANLPARERHK